jgi:hydrogenase maturation protein HypF
MALSHLYAEYGAELFDLPLSCVKLVPESETRLFLKMLERRLNSPLTSSCGRLFDAVAALIGLRGKVSYEGQAAIELEALAETACCDGVYPFDTVIEEENYLSDFGPMIRSIVRDMASGRPGAEIARCFHNTVAAVVADTCGRIRTDTGIHRVALSGGVFQNKLLSEGVYALLTENGFHAYTQRLAPPNDGGIALGQAVIAGRSLQCV